MSAEGRRLTPSERIFELALAHAQRAPAPPEPAVELSRNAKGDWQLGVTVRGHELEAVLEQAIATARRLEAEYPRGNGAPAPASSSSSVPPADESSSAGEAAS
jgi:hypothetical protein